MGTNYYARVNICDHCGRYDQVHIGKSSMGWAFSLHVIPEMQLNSLGDWKQYLVKHDVKIFDEYDEPVTINELMQIILEREFTERHTQYEHCVGIGGTTWDLIRGEFS